MTMTNTFADRFISSLSEDEIEAVMRCETLDDFIGFLSEYGFDVDEYLMSED